MSDRRIEFFFDIICPYAYIASFKIASIANKCGANLIFKPTLLGGIDRLLFLVQNTNQYIHTYIKNRII
jgi:2-hydroxychromene-2-carboxylate isomerase